MHIIIFISLKSQKICFPLPDRCWRRLELHFPCFLLLSWFLPVSVVILRCFQCNFSSWWIFVISGVKYTIFNMDLCEYWRNSSFWIYRNWVVDFLREKKKFCENFFFFYSFCSFCCCIFICCLLVFDWSFDSKLCVQSSSLYSLECAFAGKQSAAQILNLKIERSLEMYSCWMGVLVFWTRTSAILTQFTI